MLDHTLQLRITTAVLTKFYNWILQKMYLSAIYTPELTSFQVRACINSGVRPLLFHVMMVI